MFSYDGNGFLKQMRQKAGRAKHLSSKHIFRALRPVKKMDQIREVKEQYLEIEKAFNDSTFNLPVRPTVRNVTFRVAWHDSGWERRVCKDPARN